MAASKKRAGNMASLIYDQLRADILNGTLRPGTPLSQLAIAEASGTSRGPVREALRRLQQDQLVIGKANQRFQVAPFAIPDLEVVLGLHLVNMALAIQVSVPQLTAAELAHLELCVRKMEGGAEEYNQSAWEAAYRDFATSIVRHAGPRIEALIGDLVDNIQRYRMTTLNKVPRVASRGREFSEIMEAVAARNGRLAARRYAEFVGRFSMLIIAGVAPQYDASRLRTCIAAASEFDKA